MRQFQLVGDSTTPEQPRRGREGKALSAREREIVALVAQGHKNRDIAAEPSISEQRVPTLRPGFRAPGVSAGVLLRPEANGLLPRRLPLPRAGGRPVPHPHARALPPPQSWPGAPRPRLAPAPVEPGKPPPAP